MPAASEAEAAVEAVFREEWGRITASLIAMTGDWDLAEECAQDAFTRALSAWHRDGVPERPGAWLTTAARNRAIDVLRRRANEAAKLQQALLLAPEPGPPAAPDGDISDDRLRLIFTCCHPALPPEARVALTLRTLTGLTTPEIARAFLVPEPTMAQRLVRAKKKIQSAAIPYRVPSASLLPERLSGVLAVLYLLFNEGYRASSGADLVRPELSAEAIRLTRLLLTLQPGEPETAGLLALMLLNDSRRAARTDASGDPVPLPEQDRTRWDRDAIDEGCACWQLRPAGSSLACTSCRPRSPPATPAPPAPRTPTGPPSPGCTRSSPFCCPPRWWNSTVPSPWAWPTVPPRASP